MKVSNVAEFVKNVAKGSNGAKASTKLEGDGAGVERDIVRKLNYVVGKEEVDPKTAYQATALSVREHLIDGFNKTQKYWRCVRLISGRTAVG